MEKINMLQNDLNTMVHNNIITDNNVYPLIFISYMINKYDLKINNKYDNYITFISYIKENIENLSYSKDELSLFNESLSNITHKINNDSLKSIINFIVSYDKNTLIKSVSLSFNIGRDYNFNSPDSLSELVLKLINRNGSLLDMNCGNGDFLVKAILDNSNYSVTGYDINITKLLNARVRMIMLNSYYNFENVSSIDHVINEKFDSIFCIPPFGIRMNNDKTISLNFEVKKSNTYYWYYVDRMISMLKPKGKAIIILPLLPMFKNPDSSIREYLIKNKYVESIIELPEKIFNNTSIGTTMLVLSKNNNYCRMIDAKEMLLKQNRITNKIDVDKVYECVQEENKNVKLVSEKEFEDRGFSFIPSKYMDDVKDKMKNPNLLKNFLTITRGYRGKTSNDETNKKCKYIKLSNISNSEIIKNELEFVDYEYNMEKYLVQDKDILITARGSRFESAIIRVEENERIICCDSIFILRINNKGLNPYYLNFYLNSEIGQSAIFANQIKSLSLIINTSGLLNTYIDLLSIEKQNEIEKLEIKKYEIKEKYKKEIDKIDNKLDKIIKLDVM